jgi:hypothetical protein
MRANEQLNGLLDHPIRNPIVPDILSAVPEFRRSLLKKLNIKDSDLLALRPQYVNKLVRRAIHRVPPCANSGGMRNALIWLRALDFTEEVGGTVAVMSHNTKEFPADDKSSFPDALLRRKVHTRGLDVEFYPAIEDFIRRNGEPIAFITKEWLQEQLPADKLFEETLVTIKAFAEARLDSFAGENALATAPWLPDPNQRDRGTIVGQAILYAAKVRNGFVPIVRREVARRFNGLEIDTCPFANLPEKGRIMWALTKEGMETVSGSKLT